MMIKIPGGFLIVFHKSHFRIYIEAQRVAQNKDSYNNNNSNNNKKKKNVKETCLQNLEIS